VADSRHVEIVPLDVADRALLDALTAELRRVFGLTCRLLPSQPVPADAYDARRGQHHATRLLEHLVASPSPAYRRLGVVGVDLFVPILRYVFGEAMLGGRAAVVSVHRLGGPGWEDPAARSLFLARAVKEAIHELGHTFDLTHCEDPACVMASSLAVAHIDRKQPNLCAYCKVALADAVAQGGKTRG
jgi:archaemetzincin